MKCDAAPWSEGEVHVACGKGHPLRAGAACYWKAGRVRGRRELPFQSTRLCCCHSLLGTSLRLSSFPPRVRACGTSARSSQRLPTSERMLAFHKSTLHLGQSHVPELVWVLCPAPPPHATRPPRSPRTCPATSLPGSWHLRAASGSLPLPCPVLRRLPAHGHLS